MLLKSTLWLLRVPWREEKMLLTRTAVFFFWCGGGEGGGEMCRVLVFLLVCAYLYGLSEVMVRS